MPGDAIDPLEAFSPFSHEEWGRLKRYRDRAKGLFGCAFIQQSQTQWALSAGVGQPMVSEIKAGEERDLDQALMLFRPLWLREESAGFWQVQAMVKRHAHQKGTAGGRVAISYVKTYAKALNTLLSEAQSIGLREQRINAKGEIVAEEDVVPGRVFDDFLYGRYFHEDEERIKRIGDWPPSDAQRFIFLTSLKRVAGVFTRFAGIPEAILREPALRADS